MFWGSRWLRIRPDVTIMRRVRAAALVSVAVLGFSGLVFLVLPVLLSASDPLLPTDEAGEDKTEELQDAMARHGLDLPTDASDLSYHLHSSIDSDEVAVRFRTTPDGLAEFMDSPELREADLAPDRNPWLPRPSGSPIEGPETYGWDFARISSYSGVVVDSYSDQSWLGVLVDLDRPDAPVVYAYALGCC
jgi:hypothetical protein